MSRELWAVETCECGVYHEEPRLLPGGHPESSIAYCYQGGTREPLDFDAIWGRYTRLGKRTWLTKSELRKVIGLEEE